MRLLILTALSLFGHVVLAADWNCDDVRIRNDRVTEGGDPRLRALGSWPSPNDPAETLVIIGYGKGRNERVVAIKGCYPSDGRD